MAAISPHFNLQFFDVSLDSSNDNVHKAYETSEEKNEENLDLTPKEGIFCLPSEVIFYIFSFLPNCRDLSAAAQVCKEWNHLINTPSFIRPLYQKVTGAALKSLEIEKISKGHALRLYRDEMSKRAFHWTVNKMTHPPCPDEHFAQVSKSHLFLENSVPSSIQLRDSSLMQIETDLVNSESPHLPSPPPLQSSQELSEMDTSTQFQDGILESKTSKQQTLFAFNSQSHKVYLKDLSNGSIKSLNLRSTHPFLTDCTFTYFDGTRIAAVYKLKNHVFKGSIVKVFNLNGEEEKKIDFSENLISNVNIVILDNNVCWVFTAGCILQCWDISNTPKKVSSISYYDQLNQLTTPNFHEPIGGEIDETHSKFTITCEGGTVFTIDTSPTADIFSHSSSKAEEPITEESQEEPSQKFEYSPTYERRDSSMKRTGSYPRLDTRVKKLKTSPLTYSQ